MRLLLSTLLLVFAVGCAGQDDGQLRTSSASAQGAGEADESNEASRDVQGNDFAAPPARPSTKPINGSGRKVFIVCFYGENDHDNVARNMCQTKYQQCVASYGAQSCEKVINPNRAALDRIRNEGMVIVVTHTTPDPSAECKTGIDIWDSKPGITPSVVSECIDAPIVWYGCFGKGIADKCPNVIPLADNPEVLDSRDPKVECRFQASTACIEELMRRGRPFSQADVQACVEQKMPQLCPGT